MKEKIFLIVLSVFIYNIAAAQEDFWERAWPDSLTEISLNIRSLAVNSQGDIFAGTTISISGTRYYIFRSSDNGDSWTHLTNGLRSSKIYALAINDSDHIFAGVSGSGFYRSTDNGETWQRISEGLSPFPVLGLSLVINDSGHIFGGTWCDGIFRSIDNGDNWEQVNEGLDHPWSVCIHSLAINDSGQIFAGTVNGVYRSDDNGNNWQEMNQGLTTVSVWSIAIHPDNCIFAATWGDNFGSVPGNIFRSCDNGESWEVTNGDLTERYPISIISNSMGTLFVGYRGAIDNGVVYQSSNLGETWIFTGLEGSGAIWSSALNDSGWLFVGTSDGVFRSQRSTTDTTDTTTGVEQIIDKIIPKDFVLKQNYPNPFNPLTTIEFTIPRSSWVSLTIFNILGKEIDILVDEQLTPGSYRIPWQAEKLPSGVYFYQLRTDEFSQIKKMTILK